MHTGVVLFRLLWVAQVGSYAGTNSPFLDSKKEFKKKKTSALILCSYERRKFNVRSAAMWAILLHPAVN
jgi:hypothetical protein